MGSRGLRVQVRGDGVRAAGSGAVHTRQPDISEAVGEVMRLEAQVPEGMLGGWPVYSPHGGSCEEFQACWLPQ